MSSLMVTIDVLSMELKKDNLILYNATLILPVLIMTIMEFKTDDSTFYNATLILSALFIPISVIPVGLT